MSHQTTEPLVCVCESVIEETGVSFCPLSAGDKVLTISQEKQFSDTFTME